jgi:hypothetical protein
LVLTGFEPIVAGGNAIVIIDNQHMTKYGSFQVLG